MRERDCGACAERCVIVAELGGVGCQADPCADLDYNGRREGAVAQWCDEGEHRTQDCAERGRGCGWVNDDRGYFCR